jgi:hypothetical protein
MFWWLALNRHYRLIGFAAWKGTGEMMFRHGMDQIATAKVKIIEPLPTTLGQAYTADYTWDPGTHKLSYKVFDVAGQKVLEINDRPNKNHLEVLDGEDLTADFSFTGTHNPKEHPQYGWHSQNLTLEVYP